MTGQGVDHFNSDDGLRVAGRLYIVEHGVRGSIHP